MKEGDKFSWRARGRSFRYAWEGFLLFIRREHNARIHAVATLLALAAAFYWQLSRTEWIALVLVMGFVWAAELLNTSVEKLADLVSQEQKPEIKFIKDCAAAAVLVAALVAVITAGILFLPKIF